MHCHLHHPVKVSTESVSYSSTHSLPSQEYDSNNRSHNTILEVHAQHKDTATLRLAFLDMSDSSTAGCLRKTKQSIDLYAERESDRAHTATNCDRQARLCLVVLEALPAASRSPWLLVSRYATTHLSSHWRRMILGILVVGTVILTDATAQREDPLPYQQRLCLV